MESDVHRRLGRVFEKVVRVMEREAARFASFRGINYEDVDASATALLYCPRKWRLSKEYPDFEPDMPLDVREGYQWEQTAKQALELAFGERVVVEPSLTVEFSIDGSVFKLVCHPDVVVKGQQADLVIDLKSPKMLRVSPKLYIPPDGLVVTVSDDVLFPEQYVLQVALQKWFYRRITGKQVYGALFARTVTKRRNKYYRFTPVRVVVEELSDDDVMLLVRSFIESNGPRYHWECSLCQWKSVGLCAGSDEIYPLPVSFRRDARAEQVAVPEEVVEAVRRYLSLRSELRELWQYLESVVPENAEYEVDGVSVVWEGRSKWDYASLVKRLIEIGREDLINAAFRMRPEGVKLLEQVLGEDLEKYRVKNAYSKLVVKSRTPEEQREKPEVCSGGPNP